MTVLLESEGPRYIYLLDIERDMNKILENTNRKTSDCVINFFSKTFAFLTLFSSLYFIPRKIFVIFPVVITADILFRDRKSLRGEKIFYNTINLITLIGLLFLFPQTVLGVIGFAVVNNFKEHVLRLITKHIFN